MKGIVVKSTGSWYQVMTEKNTVMNCRARGKIRLEGLKTTNPIAVGDTVVYTLENESENTGVITSIEPRRNYLVRKSVNLSKRSHILAANIDRCYLLATLCQPITQQAFIDRFLVAAESFRIPTTLLFNKSDLHTEKEDELFLHYKLIYEKVGYPCVKISAMKESDIQFLKKEIKGKQVMFAGHSGTGKSTLTKAIDPAIDTKIGKISDIHQQGKHTTTFAEMHGVASGGFIIDTPGIKAFGLVDIDKNVLSHYFPEMRAAMNECKFHNCLHINEPDCKIKALVETNEIHPSRYQNYLQMMQNDEEEQYRKNIFG